MVCRDDDDFGSIDEPSVDFWEAACVRASFSSSTSLASISEIDKRDERWTHKLWSRSDGISSIMSLSADHKICL